MKHYPSEFEPERIAVHAIQAYQTTRSSTGAGATKESAVYIRPRTSRLDGKSNAAVASTPRAFHLLDGVANNDVNIVNFRLQQCEDFDNHDRPHGGQTLDEETALEETGRDSA